MSYNYLFKLLIIGEEKTGKTSICCQFGGLPFNEIYDETVGVEFSTCFTKIFNNLQIKCQLWDTSGRRSFNKIIKGYFKGVAGIVMIFDVNNRKSFERLDYWVNQFKINKTENEKVEILLLGNKVDKKNRVVSFEEGHNYAKNNKMMYFETSAKNYININESLNKFCEKILGNYDFNESHPGIRIPMKFELEKKNRDECCCIC